MVIFVVGSGRCSETKASAISEQDLIDHCQAGLARLKAPRHVRFLTERPMSATKIRKFELQQRLSEDLAVAREQAAAGETVPLLSDPLLRGAR